jgi:hypothetical protein
MALYHYSLLGVIRTRQLDKDKWVVEVSYKDEDVQSGQYKNDQIWHFVAECSNLSEVGELVLTLSKEETKR